MWIGLTFVGGLVFGIFIVSMCVASGRADDEMERFNRRHFHDLHEDDEDVENFVKRIGGHH